jgi:Ras-related protein Rab-11A
MINENFYESFEEQAQEFDEEIKIIVLGESGVGKSNLIIRYNGGQFDSNSLSNNSASFITKDLTFNDKVYRINIWDTAGQEKYHSLTKIFVKGSNIALIVYAINDKNSFNMVDFWYKILQDSCENIKICLVGNKVDLFSNKVVNEETAKKKAQEMNAGFGLTSALNEDSGIDELIDGLIKEYINTKGKKPEGQDNKKIALGNKDVKEKTEGKKGKCC